MKNKWLKYSIRHGLFTYARDSLIFFVNLFVWTAERDLQQVALFNVIYLSCHLAMFYLLLPLMKQGRSQTIMRCGILGLSLVLLGAMLLGNSVVDYLYPTAVLTGVFNGAYWFPNHVNSFDLSSNANRTSFLSYRKATVTAARLAVPAVGWIMFSLFSTTGAAYNAIFAVSMVAMFAAWYFTEIEKRPEKKLEFRASFHEIRRTKYFWLKQLNGFLYGVSLRSALATIILPFLLLQVVERESSLSLVQTIIEVGALVAAFLFARHKKNTDYITKLILLGGLVTTVGLVSMFVELTIATYTVYIISFVLALSAVNIALGTVSNNYATTIKDYDDHRIEFMAIREPSALAGFIIGYVFVYFFSDLSVDSLRPLLAFMMVATIASMLMTLKIWRYVQSNHE